MEGADCAGLGIVESKPFCVVTSRACFDTSYVIRDHDCRVLRYEHVHQSLRADCEPDTPMFVNRW